MSPAFEKASGQKLVTIRGPSLGDSPEAIPNRLKRGEAVDVVIMVGASIDDLTGQGLVRAGAAKPDIGSVDAFKQTLLGAKVANADGAAALMKCLASSEAAPHMTKAGLGPLAK